MRKSNAEATKKRSIYYGILSPDWCTANIEPDGALARLAPSLGGCYYLLALSVSLHVSE